MKKRVLLIAAAVLGVAAARRYWSMRDALAAVPADLRSPVLPFLTMDVTARNVWFVRLPFRFGTPAGPGVSVRRHFIDGLRVHVTTPATAPTAGRRPGVLYLHGGGMISGSPQMEALNSGRLARDLDAVVVAPDYRLSPEHPFPAGLDDCMSALAWMRDEADTLVIDPDRIAVIGSSAGGGLSAAVAQRAHDEGIALRAQVLVYPMIDDRTALRTDHGGRGRFLWTAASNRYAWTAYLGREPRMSDAPEYAAPARRTNVAGLAPAWIGVGGLDLFHDEAVAYAGTLTAGGVPCELVTVPGMYHGADGIAWKDPAILAFRRSSVDHLRAYL